MVSELVRGCALILLLINNSLQAVFGRPFLFGFHGRINFFRSERRRFRSFVWRVVLAYGR